MRLDSPAVYPGHEFLNPTIIFGTNIIFAKGDEAIIKVDGWLESNDNIKISYMSEYLTSDSREETVKAKGTRVGSQVNEDNYYIHLIAELNDKALTFIESERMKNEKRDVNLKIILNINYINSKANIAYVFRINPQQTGATIASIQNTAGREVDIKFLVEANDREYMSDRTNGWYLSGDNGPEFLSVKNQKIIHKFRIPSADWINEYSPKFGLGEFFTIQIPRGKKILTEAWGYIEQAETCFQNWNTKGVYANCRECGKLLDKNIKECFGKSSFIYKERWGRFYSRFETLASLNLHLEDLKASFPPEDVQIYKSDSEHLLINTKALVKFAEELLIENK